MVDLAGPTRPVACIAKVLGHHEFVAYYVPPGLGIVIQTRDPGGFAAEHGGAGWIAGRGNGVGPSKGDRRFRKAIQMWRLGLRMAAHRADPIVHIVERNDEYVRFRLRIGD